MGKKMAINPLQAAPSTTVFPELYTERKNATGVSAFDTLLSTLRTNGSAPSLPAQQAAAEMLQMEMMQKTLSLSGEGEASPPTGIGALESLLARFAAAAKPTLSGFAAPPGPGLSGKVAAGRVPDGEAALLTEISPGSSPGTGAKVDDIEKTAAQFLGMPYRFGGESATGIDCSSFVQQVFRENQIDLPRTARDQSKMGSEVAPGDLKKGDLVFFHTYASYPSHVGIYLGDGKMIHASSGKGEVTVSDLNSDYYRSRFIGAKRLA
jgi:cell wall-associated NlpC family hydrolase